MGSSRKGLGPGEDEVRLNNVTNESEHSNASVLDLRLTQESDGGLRSHAVEVGLCQVQRVVELYNRVGLLGDGFQVSLGSSSSGDRSSLLRRSEGRSASGDGGKDKTGLHCGQLERITMFQKWRM